MPSPFLPVTNLPLSHDPYAFLKRLLDQNERGLAWAALGALPAWDAVRLAQTWFGATTVRSIHGNENPEYNRALLHWLHEQEVPWTLAIPESGGNLAQWVVRHQPAAAVPFLTSPDFRQALDVPLTEFYVPSDHLVHTLVHESRWEALHLVKPWYSSWPRDRNDRMPWASASPSSEDGRYLVQKLKDLDMLPLNPEGWAREKEGFTLAGTQRFFSSFMGALAEALGEDDETRKSLEIQQGIEMLGALSIRSRQIRALELEKDWVDRLNALPTAQWLEKHHVPREPSGRSLLGAAVWAWVLQGKQHKSYIISPEPNLVIRLKVVEILNALPPEHGVWDEVLKSGRVQGKSTTLTVRDAVRWMTLEDMVFAHTDVKESNTRRRPDLKLSGVQPEELDPLLDVAELLYASLPKPRQKEMEGVWNRVVQGLADPRREALTEPARAGRSRTFVPPASDLEKLWLKWTGSTATDQVNRWAKSALPIAPVFGGAIGVGRRDESLPATPVVYWLRLLEQVQQERGQLEDPKGKFRQAVLPAFKDWIASQLGERRDPRVILNNLGWAVSDDDLAQTQRQPDDFKQALTSLRRQAQLSQLEQVTPARSRMRPRG